MGSHLKIKTKTQELFPTKAVDVSADKTIGTATVTGPQNATALTAENYDVEISGNVIDETYAWTVTGGANADYNIDDATIKTPAITFKAAGDYNVTCKVSSATSTEGSSTSAPLTVVVAGIPNVFDGVSLGGSQSVNTLNVGKTYSSNASGGVTLQGTTTYQWTAEDENGETTANGAVFSTNVGQTATDQNTQIVFTKDGQTYKVRCKWTNYSYDPSTRTGMRTVVVDTTAPDESE